MPVKYYDKYYENSINNALEYFPGLIGPLTPRLAQNDKFSAAKNPGLLKLDSYPSGRLRTRFAHTKCALRAE